MALGNYTDVYKLKDYKARVLQIQAETAMAVNGPILTQGKAALSSQIYLLQQKESQLFKLLGVNSVQELNSRMEEYKQAVINFSGINLKEIFIQAMSENFEKEKAVLTEAISEVIKNYGFTQEELKKVGNNIYKRAMLILNKEGGGKFTVTSKAGYGNDEIFPSYFTEAQKKRWQQILKSSQIQALVPQSKAKQYADIYLQESPVIQTSSNGDSYSAQIQWQINTEGLTSTEAKKLPDDQLNLINLKMTNFIVSKAGADAELIRTIILHILRQDPYAFFVGKNVNDIAGLLGEISGLYYLSKFLGGFSQQVLQWRGGTHTGTGGAKPHQDILLKGFGIQVKNSMAEAFGTVNFANAGIQTMLQKANLSPQTKNLFLNFYATQGFNQPYYWDGNEYISGSPSPKSAAFQEFEISKKNLDALEDDIDRLLNLSAAFFMYMDVYGAVQGMDANVLYFLGGTAFQTASNILKEVLDNIEKAKHNFNIKASYKKWESHNIITALNDNTRSPGYSQAALNDIILTSSYNFSSLLKKK